MAGDSITDLNPLVVENVISDSTLIAIFSIIDNIAETMETMVRIYPNPARDVINIEMEGIFGMQNPSIEIVDIHGKSVMVLKPVSNSTHFNIKQLDRGLYLLKINYANTSISKKIVFQ
jgi:hypothetical protein